MKDEIKEMNLSEMLFNRDERLLDYITNLQEENERLKHNLEQMYNDTKDTYNEICTEYVDYKSRNEKANWWLKEMLKQAKNDETKAIINGTLDLLLQGSDKDD